MIMEQLVLYIELAKFSCGASVFFYRASVIISYANIAEN